MHRQAPRLCRLKPPRRKALPPEGLSCEADPFDVPEIRVFQCPQIAECLVRAAFDVEPLTTCFQPLCIEDTAVATSPELGPKLWSIIHQKPPSTKSSTMTNAHPQPMAIFFPRVESMGNSFELTPSYVHCVHCSRVMCVPTPLFPVPLLFLPDATSPQQQKPRAQARGSNASAHITS